MWLMISAVRTLWQQLLCGFVRDVNQSGETGMTNMQITDASLSPMKQGQESLQAVCYLLLKKNQTTQWDFSFKLFCLLLLRKNKKL